MLIECLISMVLVGLAGAASVYALGRGSNMQYRTTLQAQTVEQLRALVMSQGAALCSAASPSITVSGHSYTVTVSQTAPYCQAYAGLTVSVPGQSTTSVTLPAAQVSALQLSVSSPVLGGTVTFTSD